MEPKGKKDNDTAFWIFFVLFMSMGLWFVGLPMLFFKMAGSDGKKAVPPSQTTQAAPQSRTARQTAGRQQKKGCVGKAPTMKSSSAKWLKIGGMIGLICGAGMLMNNLETLFYVDQISRYLLWDVLQGASWLAGGIALLTAGLGMDKQARRCQKYLTLLGDEARMPIGQLARKLGYSEKTVRRDLERMIDRGFFGGQAYLNAETDCFCRTPDADRAAEPAPQEKAAPAPETEQGYSGILRNIRRANDGIADPALSLKIDRLEEISAKIFRAVEEDPDKRGRIDTFLNYYLPTTQKLLDAYAEFESAGVEGENLRQAKVRIETTMDAIVAGFEHQLDELYKADAMDVDSDIRVMETMLHRDTASVEKDFGLGSKFTEESGGTAVQREI